MVPLFTADTTAPLSPRTTRIAESDELGERVADRPGEGLLERGTRIFSLTPDPSPTTERS